MSTDKTRNYEMVPRWFVTWARPSLNGGGWLPEISIPLAGYRDAESLVAALKTVKNLDCIEIVGPTYMRCPVTKATRKTFNPPDLKGRVKDYDHQFLSDKKSH